MSELLASALGSGAAGGAAGAGASGAMGSSLSGLGSSATPGLLSGSNAVTPGMAQTAAAQTGMPASAFNGATIAGGSPSTPGLLQQRLMSDVGGGGTVSQAPGADPQRAQGIANAASQTAQQAGQMAGGGSNMMPLLQMIVQNSLKQGMQNGI